LRRGNIHKSLGVSAGNDSFKAVNFCDGQGAHQDGTHHAGSMARSMRHGNTVVNVQQIRLNIFTGSSVKITARNCLHLFQQEGLWQTQERNFRYLHLYA
jgi:hypothetical protein